MQAARVNSLSVAPMADAFRKFACAGACAAAICALSAPCARAEGFFSFLEGGYSSRDGGGNVLDYYETVRSANYSRRPLPIEGYCASACTMKLGARTACVSPNATLRFHSASSYGARSWGGNTLMMSLYPPRIRAWVMRHNALDSLSFTDMSGSEAIALGVKAC